MEVRGSAAAEWETEARVEEWAAAVGEERAAAAVVARAAEPVCRALE